MNIKTTRTFLSLIITSTLFAGSVYAQENRANKRDDVAENYLSPNKGSTVPALTDMSKDSRWYATFRVKGSYTNENARNAEYLQLNGRLRGKTYFADKTALVGDFWMRAQENYSRLHGETINEFNDFDDNVKWEQFRVGISHDDLGAFMYGKHTATWSFFAVDMGSQGLLDTQADAGVKNAGKFLYKKQFPNDLFLAGSYDRTSKIYGVDIGYQTNDLYSFRPGDYGVYASMHNGQPSVTVGSTSIVGNVDIAATRRGDIKNADSKYARDSTSLYTWALAGYANIGNQYRLVGQTAYSKRDKSESKELIKKRGWAKGGLGHSATIGAQMFPEKASGFSYILYNTYDEFGGASITPQLEYWFGSPNLRAWLSYTWEEKADDITRLEFQWDF